MMVMKMMVLIMIMVMHMMPEGNGIGDEYDDCPRNGSDDSDNGDDDHYDGAGDDDSKDWGMKMMIVHIMEVWSKP